VTVRPIDGKWRLQAWKGPDQDFEREDADALPRFRNEEEAWRYAETRMADWLSEDDLERKSYRVLNDKGTPGIDRPPQIVLTWEPKPYGYPQYAGNWLSLALRLRDGELISFTRSTGSRYFTPKIAFDKAQVSAKVSERFQWSAESARVEGPFWVPRSRFVPLSEGAPLEQKRTYVLAYEVTHRAGADGRRITVVSMDASTGELSNPLDATTKSMPAMAAESSKHRGDGAKRPQASADPIRRKAPETFPNIPVIGLLLGVLVAAGLALFRLRRVG
jgi:hypothetical protein